MMKTTFTKDPANKKMFISREFAGSLKNVWQAWTDPELLDQWWAPKPWRAETKSMDFRPGGVWLYSMVGPDGERHWAKAEYKAITSQKGFEYLDAFCDENGVLNTEFPRMNWKTSFSSTASGTKVDIEITYTSVPDMEKIMAMGFQEGFTAAHSNLDELLSSINVTN